MTTTKKTTKAKPTVTRKKKTTPFVVDGKKLGGSVETVKFLKENKIIPDI